MVNALVDVHNVISANGITVVPVVVG